MITLANSSKRREKISLKSLVLLSSKVYFIYESFKFLSFAVIDPKNYWGRKIFEDAHRYLTRNRQTLAEFFKDEGMETDFSISQFDFTKAMNTLVKSIL